MKQTKKQPAALKSTGWGIPLAKRSLPRLVYVIELDPAVSADPAFAASNPGYVSGPAYYCGSTSLDPLIRFSQHISGSKNASRIAHEFGLILRMDLVPNQKGPISRKAAIAKEAKLARDLREKGFGAWQA